MFIYFVLYEMYFIKILLFFNFLLKLIPKTIDFYLNRFSKQRFLYNTVSRKYESSILGRPAMPYSQDNYN